MLQGLRIRHDGVGQVCQILLSEEGQRQLPQLLRQGDAALAGFNVCCEERGIVLPVIRKEDQYEAGRRKEQVICPPPCRCTCQIIPGKREQQPDRRHQRDIRSSDRCDRFEHIRGAFFRQRKPFHQNQLHAVSPTFQLTAI